MIYDYESYSIIKSLMFSVDKYKKYKTWKETFPDCKPKIDFSVVDPSWNVFMKEIIESTDLQTLEKKLGTKMNTGKNIFPYPSLELIAFKYCRFNDLKVVIIGQDPYFKMESGVPQAMGLSFSVPIGIEIPSSLDNIYKNMIKYNHISQYPTHGNLEFYANQGCLFLNTSLTVTENEKNSHADIWISFTQSIIVKLSNDCENLVFVLWGAPALENLGLIDRTKHKVIISSHPSGLSCNNTLKSYPAFVNNDHFGQINDYLASKNKQKIIWGL